MKKIIRPIIVLTVLAAAAWFGWPWIEENFLTEPDPNLLFSSGVVECTEVHVGSELSGPITELPVKEGDTVFTGDLIARIDAADLLIQLQGAQANVERSRSLLADTQKGLRPQEIKQLQQVVQAKQAIFEQCQIDYQRKKELADKDVAPMNPAILAEKAMQAAKEDLQAARQQVTIAQMGARSDQISAARSALRQAESKVSEINQRIADAEVVSPLDGIVNTKLKQQGEITTMGSTLVSIVDLDQPWVRVYIPENKLGRVKLGMQVDIKSDSYPDKTYTGEIRHISPEAEFTPKNVQTQEERVKLVYAAKVFMDNSHREFKPGMPVDVYIHLASSPE